MTRSDERPTPEQEAVRRLLAGSRHTAPTPPEVVARLDRVLGDLAGEPGRTAPVVDLARRRRRAASLLIAAAVVVVVGIGVDQVVNQSGSDAEFATSTAEDSGADSEAESQEPGTQAESPAEVDPNSQDGVLRRKGLIRVRPDHFAADVTAARRTTHPLTNDKSVRGRVSNRDFTELCSRGSWGRGRYVPVRYGGPAAVLVFRRPVGDSEVVDLFLCGGREPVRSVTLPAR